MKIYFVVGALLLQASVAMADRMGNFNSSRGVLKVVKGFSISSTRNASNVADSMTLKPGTYAFELGNGSYYKSTLCDLLPYCTKRWETDPSYFTEFVLVKKSKDGVATAGKRVSFNSKLAGSGAVDGVLPNVAIGQNLKVYQRSKTSSRMVNQRQEKIECMIKSRCWDPDGYRCSYVAGTQTATLADEEFTTRIQAKFLTLSNVTLATYEAVESQTRHDVVISTGRCTPNVSAEKP